MSKQSKSKNNRLIEAILVLVMVLSLTVLLHPIIMKKVMPLLPSSEQPVIEPLAPKQAPAQPDSPEKVIVQGPAGVLPTINLTTTNTATLRGEVNYESVSAVEQQLNELIASRGQRDTPLFLVLDSPGGSIQDGIGLIDFLKQIKNLNTISLFAASMASGIVEAVPGTRYVTEHGVLMFHRAYGSFEGFFENGEVESRLGFAKAIVSSMERVNASRLGLTLEQYKAKVVLEYWLYADQAVTEKAADKLVAVKCSKDLTDATTTIAVRSLFGSYDLVFSQCPLMRGPLKTQTQPNQE